MEISDRYNFDSRVKKVLVLVKCPQCKGAFYVNAAELVKIPFTVSVYYRNVCKLSGKSVKLERIA